MNDTNKPIDSRTRALPATATAITAAPRILEEYILRHNVSGDFRDSLQVLIDSDQAGLLALLVEYLSPSVNSLKEIFELIDGSARRDRLAFADLMQHLKLEEVLTESAGNRKDKLKELRRRAELLRFPVLAKIRAQLAQHEKSLKHKHGVRLELPEELEGDRLELRISFKSSEELERAAERLIGLARDQELKSLFAILKGDIDE